MAWVLGLMNAPSPGLQTPTSIWEKAWGVAQYLVGSEPHVTGLQVAGREGPCRQYFTLVALLSNFHPRGLTQRSQIPPPHLPPPRLLAAVQDGRTL